MIEYYNIKDGPISQNNNMWFLFRECVSKVSVPSEITKDNMKHITDTIARHLEKNTKE